MSGTPNRRRDLHTPKSRAQRNATQRSNTSADIRWATARSTSAYPTLQHRAETEARSCSLAAFVGESGRQLRPRGITNVGGLRDKERLRAAVTVSPWHNREPKTPMRGQTFLSSTPALSRWCPDRVGEAPRPRFYRQAGQREMEKISGRLSEPLTSGTLPDLQQQRPKNAGRKTVRPRYPPVQEWIT